MKNASVQTVIDSQFSLCIEKSISLTVSRRNTCCLFNHCKQRESTGRFTVTKDLRNHKEINRTGRARFKNLSRSEGAVEDLQGIGRVHTVKRKFSNCQHTSSARPSGTKFNFPTMTSAVPSLHPPLRPRTRSARGYARVYAYVSAIYIRGRALCPRKF